LGALVQANYGDRDQLRIDGVAVGEAIPVTDVASPYGASRSPVSWTEAGSIIGLVATDAPLLPNQCQRLATRAAIGAARVGCYASHGSGDMFLAWSTGNRGLSASAAEGRGGPKTVAAAMVADAWISPLLLAAVEATEEAIVNALVAADTMTGINGTVAYRLPHNRLVEAMAAAGRLNR
jgi:D-aminopeptidase